MKKQSSTQQNSGLTGPLDPALERAHLLARWEEAELTGSVPLAPLDGDWLYSETPAAKDIVPKS